MRRTIKLTLLIALLLAGSLAASAQDQPVTRIEQGGFDKMRYFHAHLESEPGAPVQVGAAIVTDMPLYGDFFSVGVFGPQIIKGKAKLIVSGREIKTRKTLWSRPVSFENVPLVRTTCYRGILSVNCVSRQSSYTAERYGAVDGVSFMLKPAEINLLINASDVRFEVSGETFTLEPRHLDMLRALLTASSQSPR